jgi:Domain of unknown function (DUF4592)
MFTKLFLVFCLFFVAVTSHNNSNQLDTFTNSKHKTDPELTVGESTPLLDNSAQKHKLSIKPKKRHASSAHRSISSKKFKPEPGER